MPESDETPGTLIAQLRVIVTGAAYDADGTLLDAEGNRVEPLNSVKE